MGFTMQNATGSAQTIALFGGTSEIGLEIVRALITPTTERVVLACRNTTAGQASADALDGDMTVDVIEWDAADISVSADVVDAVAQNVHDIDIAIIAAAQLGDQQTYNADPAAAAQAIIVNTAGPIAVLTALSERMKHQGHGTIIVLSSVAGVRVRSDNRVYGASKAGLDGFARALANDLEGTGVVLTVVRPGFVTGRMTAGSSPAPFATDPKTVARTTVDAVARGRQVVWVPGVLGYVFAVLQLLPNVLWRRLKR